jgi:hypothetical protein
VARGWWSELLTRRAKAFEAALGVFGQSARPKITNCGQWDTEGGILTPEEMIFSSALTLSRKRAVKSHSIG